MSAHLVILASIAICGPNAALMLWQLLVLKPLHYAIALNCQTLGYVLAHLCKSGDGGGDDAIERTALLFPALSASFFYLVRLALTVAFCQFIF